MIDNRLSRVLRAGLLTGITDGLFACIVAITVMQSTIMRLWQGVSSTLLGPAALEGGPRTAWIGVLMHFGVALGWSVVFLLIVMQSRWIRGVVARPQGIVKVAAVYGPVIWLVMSLIVIPLLVHRPPAITLRWWVQLIGHFPFVGLPIAWSIARGIRERDA
jgi:hypothetical protein